MTEKQLEHGFWLWEPENEFPPKSIVYTSEYQGQEIVNVSFTQRLNKTPQQQKILTKEWVDFLPTCKKIEMLWFTSLTTQKIFNSVCEIDNLIGLNIKWSNIKTLDNIEKLKKLKYLRIGSSAQIESILPLTTLKKLEVLYIENLKKIKDFSLLGNLTNLKFLSIEGSMYTKQKVNSFNFLTDLINLIYLSTAMVSCDDKSVDSLLRLKKLVTLNWASKLSNEDIAALKANLHELKYLPHRYNMENINKIKALFE